MRILRRAAASLVVVLLVAAVLVEVAGRLSLEDQLEERLARAGVAGRAEVVLGNAWWRPTVLPVLLGGHLDRVEVRLRDAEMYTLPVAVADYVLEDLDVSISITERTVAVSSLRRGSVRVLVDPRSIASDLGIDATAVGSDLLVGPAMEPAEVFLDGVDLVVTSPAFSSADGSTRLPVVDPALLPCSPAVSVSGGLIHLRCSGDRLPTVLSGVLSAEEPVDLDRLPRAPVELEPPLTIELEPQRPEPTTEAGG